MSHRANPGRHPPSQSFQAPPATTQQQYNPPLYSSSQLPSTGAEAFAVSYPESHPSNLSHLQSFVNPMQSTVARSPQPRPRPHQRPRSLHSTSSPSSSRHSSTPTRPKPIPSDKLNKAVKLYSELLLAQMLEQQQETRIYNVGQMNIPAPGSSKSAPSGTLSRMMPASRTSSAYGGTTDPSSIISFDNEGTTSPTSRGQEGKSYDGKTVPIRARKRFTPAGRAETALKRHLSACSKCHTRNVKCSLDHHDIEAIKREKRRLERQGIMSPIGLPQSGYQSIPRPAHTFSPVSSHDTMGPASTGQFREGVEFIGLNRNDHHLIAESDPSASDLQSPSQYTDHLSGIRAETTSRLQIDTLNPFALTRVGLEINNPASQCKDGALFTIGTQQPNGGFTCSYSLEGGCSHTLENPEVLQIHFERTHFPFTRIDPAHRYVCSKCNTFFNMPVNLCVMCRCEDTCEIRIYGRYINASLDQQFANDDQSLFSPFSPTTNNFSSAGFDVQSTQTLGLNGGMGSSGFGDMTQGGYFSHSSANGFQYPDTFGSSHRNSNSPSDSQTGDFRLQGNNSFSINAVVEGNFDYFHAKGRQKLHRHRLLAITLIMTTTFISQVCTAIGARGRAIISLTIVGFAGMLAAFVGSNACWNVKKDLLGRNLKSVRYALHCYSSYHDLIIISLSAMPLECRR